MRSFPLWLFLSMIASISAEPDEYSPFLDPSTNTHHHPLVGLWKRQGCQSGYTQCTSQNAPGDCCPPNTSCSRDAANNVACCPFNAVCTGLISGTATLSGASSTTTATSNTGGFVLGGTTTSTTTFQSPSSSTTTTTTTPTITGSTVANGPYPFIYIPTTYPNAASCSSAWTYCQSESTSCFASLAGANGVTVTGLGGGTTVQGTSGTVLASASSICSSLSTVACYNLQLQQCSSFGTSNGGGGVSTTTVGASGTQTQIQVAAAGPRMTACPAMVYAMGAGVVVGAAGGVL